MRPKNSTTHKQTWQDNLDQGLTRRLTRPLVQPGIVGRQLPQGLLARTQRMTARLPLLPGLLRRWGSTGDIQTGPMRQTFLMPAAHRPTTRNLQGPRLSATDSDRLSVDTGSLPGHQSVGKVQRSQTKAGGQEPFKKQLRKQPLVSRPDSYRSWDEPKPTAGTAQQPTGIQSNITDVTGGNQTGGHTRLRVADSPADSIIQSKAILHPSKSREKEAGINSPSADHKQHGTNLKQPMFFKKSSRQPMAALKDSPGSTKVPKPTTGTAQQPIRAPSRLADVAGINNIGALDQQHHADLPAEQVTEPRATVLRPETPDNSQIVVSPLTDHGPPISNMGRQLFFKKSAPQPKVVSGGYSSSITKLKETTTPGPIGVGTHDAVGTATRNNNFGVSILQLRRADNGGPLTSPKAAIRSQPTAKDEPKAFAGSEIQLVWRKGGNDSPPGNNFSTGTESGPQTPSTLNLGPAGDHLLFTAPQRTPAGRAMVAPGPPESSESTQPIAENGWNEAAGIDLPKLAQQVSRLISRQLLVRLERRGIGRWP